VSGVKVILKERIKNLGEKDDIVEVKDGYARNYLIPRGLAEEASAGNIDLAKSRRKSEEIRQQKERAEAEKAGKKLDGAIVEIKAKAGESGKLFGSVTSIDIANALKKSFGLSVDRKKIIMTGPIKSIGESTVEVRLHPGVSARLKVRVTS
jgi:large subunit ribosomal protein L9